MQFQKKDARKNTFNIIKQFTNISCFYGSKSQGLNFFYKVNYLPKE